MGIGDFSLGIARFLADTTARSLEVQVSKSQLAETTGPLADQRAQARSLSKPSHPDAGRLIAESSPIDRPTLFSTRGNAGPFREGLMAAANRSNITAA